MDAKVIWKGNLAFDGQNESGSTLPLGADSNVGGGGGGFRPMQLLAIGLAGCTAMDVISIMTKKRQNVTAFEVQVHAGRSESHPKVFTDATIEYIVTGIGIDEIALQRSIELSATTYCPAHAMFSQVMPISLRYQILEDLGNGQRSLVKEDEFRLPELAG
jgi:putative redox protein